MPVTAGPYSAAPAPPAVLCLPGSWHVHVFIFVLDDSVGVNHRRRRSPTILHVSSQHRSQVCHSHSMSPSAPRGCVTPHRHRIGSPTTTWRSRRSLACRCPESGNQTNGREDCSSAADIGEVPPTLLVVKVNGTQSRGEHHPGSAACGSQCLAGCVSHAQGE